MRRMVAISPGRSEPMAAKMRMAPRVGTAIFATSPEKMARMTSIHTPDQIAAHRVRPPTVTLSAVWPTEPPTAMPRKKPAARLPSPLRDDVLVRIRLRSAGVGRGFGDPGALDEDDGGDRQRAGDQAERKEPDVGQLRQRDAARDVALVPDPGHAVRAGQHDHDGRDHQGDQRADHGQPSPGQYQQDRERAQPGRAATPGGCCPGGSSTLTALAKGKSPCAGAPVRSAIWPQTMLTEIPVRNPIITEYETNLV